MPRESNVSSPGSTKLMPRPRARPSAASRAGRAPEAVRVVIRREIKQRRDSIEAYEKARRADLVAKEEAELGVLSAYLPQQLSREDRKSTRLNSSHSQI